MKITHFEVSDVENTPEEQAILKGIIEFNDQFRTRDSRPLTLSLKNDKGDVIAGLTGHTGSGWLFVKLLWVHQDSRLSGIGKQLLDKAEEEASLRGCHSAWLDTFSFQARGFYEKNGYAVFGQLNEYPSEHQRFFMKKVLVNKIL